MTPDKNKLYRFVTLTMEDVGLIEAMLGDGSIVEVDGPAYRIDLKTEKPIPGRYLANDSDLVSYLKNRGVLVEVGEERP